MKINKFFCFELESAGIFFGWLGIILNSLLLIILTPYLLFSSFFDSNDALEIVNATDITGIVSLENDKSGLSPGLKMFLVGILYATIVFKLGVSKLLIDGSKKRHSQFIKPWLIVNAITIIIECILIIAVHSSILLLTSFDIYLWLCIYSLYKRIQSEEQGHCNIPYEMAVAQSIDVV